MLHRWLEPVAHTLAADGSVLPVARAGWPTAHARKSPEQIRRIPQPAARPARKPVEHSWDAVRETWVHTRVFHAVRKVVDTRAVGVRSLAAHPARVRSMTNGPHVRVLQPRFKG
jgi:hypothetical protein